MPISEQLKLLSLRATVALLSPRRDQEQEFTHHQSLVQRILAVSSSCTSIVFCLLAIYFLLAIDPRRFIFRHQLILFLILFDLLKACILLLYPSRVLTHYSAYYNDRFCQIVGFFTATAIEGADMAILAFAVHTFLLIFKPSFSIKVNNSDRMEGGLYRYRWYVYAASFLIPLCLASLAFIRSDGYDPFVCWCYLPQRPVWYRLVLSWVPRYVIVVIIFLVYGAIYFHVLKEFKTLGGVFTTIHKVKANGIYPHSLNDKPSFFSALTYFFSAVKDHLLPKLVIPEENDNITRSTSRKSNIDPKETTNSQKHQSEADNDDDDDDDDDENNDTGVVTFGEMKLDTENIINDPDIHAANLENFRKRQKIIEKQMKSIFIYPFAYCFVWLFPFILQCTQFNYEETNGPVYWLNCMGAFMQPLNGFIDSLVFFYREKPWKHTIMKNFEKEHALKMNNLVIQGHHSNNNSFPYNRANSQGYNNTNDTESTATSARYTRNSLSISLGVDLSQYPYWRMVLSKLKLPYFALPTEENVTNFQFKYLNNKLDEIRGTQLELMNNSNPATNNLQYHETKLSKHDFSNVLSGDLSEKDFRSTLENFSLNFNPERRESLSSLLQSGRGHNSLSKPTPAGDDSSGTGTINGSDNGSYTGSNRHGSTASAGNDNPINHSAGSSFSSQKPFKVRHVSMADPNEPVIFEGKRYNMNSVADSPQSNIDISTKPQSQLSLSAAANTISLLNSLKQHRAHKNSLHSSTGASSFNSSANSSSASFSLPRRFTKQSNRPEKRPSQSESVEPKEEDPDDEMDFLEFLRKGPS